MTTPPAPDRFEPGGVARPRLLVVDDRADNLDLLREIFEEECDVVAAGDAESALFAAQEHPPDLAILDVSMPEIDGYELCRRLRSDAVLQRLPIIFLTAHATSPQAAVRGLDLGACDYVTKPFDADELRARVRSALRTSGERAEDMSIAKSVTRRLLGR
jgi:DNA-binding response OmpR family regulator